jgi:very-short-patch-repair endonuclease
MSTKRNHSQRAEVPVALLKAKLDFAVLQEQGWYRIPVASAPKRWPPRWIAFYQPKEFGEEAFRIHHYGEVNSIRVVPRRELFPNEIESSLSERLYYKIGFHRIETLDKPILSLRPRRLVFVPTTWEKFILAEQINDLFDDSPLEDLLWRHLKRLQIQAERQWALIAPGQRFYLDFAIFCAAGAVDVETDGDTWHASLRQIEVDNIRQNAIASKGWHILRFNSMQIHEKMDAYCLPQIEEMITSLGGLSDDGLVSRKFYPQDQATQLTLLEEQAAYIVDTDIIENLEF